MPLPAGDYPAADGQLQESLAAMSRISPTHLDTQNTLIELIRLNDAWGRPLRAAAYRAQLEAARTPAKAPSSK